MMMTVVAAFSRDCAELSSYLDVACLTVLVQEKYFSTFMRRKSPDCIPKDGGEEIIHSYTINHCVLLSH